MCYMQTCPRMYPSVSKTAETDPIGTLAEESALCQPQIEAALRYRAAYPEEIDARIELHRRETASASLS